ncbi:MAG: hypothetical protein WDZ85_01610 [Candidatus Paceibacterota bacterium]
MARESRDIIRARQKQQARRLRLLKTYLWLFFYTFVFVGLVLLSQLDRLAVTDLAVRGEEAVSADKLKQTIRPLLAGNHFYLFSRRNVLLLPRAEIRQTAYRQFPRIGDLAIEVEDQTLILTVSERRPAALWCQAEECWYMDDSGFVFASAPDFSDNVFLKIHGSPVDADSTETRLVGTSPLATRPLELADLILLPTARTVLINTLQAAGLEQVEITKVTVTADHDYEFIIRQSVAEGPLTWRLLFDSRDDFDHSLANLTAALVSESFKREYEDKAGRLDYLDLRFGNKVFYRFK